MRFIIFGAFMALLAPTAQAADIEAGQKLARQCSVCHGKQGIARDPEVPHLAGQSSLYLEKAIKDFRDGHREDRRMTLAVKNLTDEEIRNLAAYYEAFEIQVVAPE
ncbi:MAG: cytochrome c [Pseudomonadota bacterium]